MKNYIKLAFGLCLAALLAACGGGGGSAGATTGGGVSAGTTATATITLGLTDASGAATVAVSASGATTLRATVRDATGAVVANRLVTFTADADKIAFPGGASALTNSAGVASVQIAPASLLSAGAGTIQASTLVGGVTVAGSVDYQLAAANLSLATLSLGSSTLAAYGNRAISVVANVNGSPSSTPVQVSFSANCGTVEPATAITNASGVASITYKANGTQGCGGNSVVITASAPGTSPVSGSLNIDLAPATNLQFVSATPATIYLSGSGGATQAQVQFRVVNAAGDPQQGINVRLSLVNAPTGVSIDTVGNAAAVVKTTDLSGVVNVPVFSGTVPSPLQVKAQLVANAAVETTSSILTVASGRAVQLRSSLALEKFAIEGGSIDGVTSRVTMSLADRQGNPVPDGTVINFTTEGGVMIPPTCVVTGGASQCAVSIRAQEPRSANGRVSILAYVQGEEDFVDANFNNVYDTGETFTDIGNAYRDDDESGAYNAGEFTVPRAGSTTCTGGTSGRPNTCDGVWGAVDVRREAVIIFATSGVTITGTAARAGYTVSVADLNGNSPTTGSTIANAVLGSPASGCTVDPPIPATVLNTLTPVTVSISPGTKCVAGDVIRVTVTSPSGVGTLRDFTLP